MSSIAKGALDPPAVSLRTRWIWLKQVAADQALTRAALHVALALADKVNSEKGYAWPRQAVLVKTTGLKERAVRDLTDELVARGHLARKVSRGPGASNEYRLLLKDAEVDGPKDPGDASENRHGGAGISADDRSENRHSDAGIDGLEIDENQHGGAGENRHGDDRNTGTAVPPNIPMNRSKGTEAKQPPVANLPPARSAAAALSMSDEELLRRLRNVASLKIADDPGARDVQPIRALMAEGADLYRHIAPAVEAFVRHFGPLRTWRAGPLAADVRARMAAEPARITAEPERSHDIRGVKVPEPRILARVRGYIETGVWPDDVRDRWGPAPDEFGTNIPSSLFRWTPTEGPMLQVNFRDSLIPEGNLRMMVFRWQRTGAWNGSWSYPPDDERTSVPPQFRRPRLPPAAPEPRVNDEVLPW